MVWPQTLHLAAIIAIVFLLPVRQQKLPITPQLKAISVNMTLIFDSALHYN
jgi:hypothetical protein